jgi:hypothetical protein
MTETIKLKIDFYADGFKHCVVTVPKIIERYCDYDREKYIYSILAWVMNDNGYKREWFDSLSLAEGRTRDNTITIITCKYVRDEDNSNKYIPKLLKIKKWVDKLKRKISALQGSV